MVPMLLAVVSATVVARLLGAPSIYSARISAAPIPAVPREDDEPPELRAPGDLLPDSMG